MPESELQPWELPDDEWVIDTGGPAGAAAGNLPPLERPDLGADVGGIGSAASTAPPPAPVTLQDTPLPDVVMPTEHAELTMDRSPTRDEVHAEDVVGLFDAFAARVVAVAYAGADGILGQTQTATVARVGFQYAANNVPTAYDAPAAGSQNQTYLAYALPFPPRHDQVAYHVAVGDIVTVVSGRDGRCYFFSDELPFIAQVVKRTSTVKEDTNGGAGVGQIKVRRQAISGDPSTVVAAVADLADGSGAVEYDHVLPVCSGDIAAGYRCGDYVMVHRRGAYYFAAPQRTAFLAAIVAAGPNEEENLAGDSYWVREQTATVTYEANSNSYSITYANKTQTDPTGSGGRYGRWVQAVNLYSTDKRLPAGTKILVQAVSDPTNTEIGYVFRGATTHNALLDGAVHDDTTASDPVKGDLIYGAEVDGTVRWTPRTIGNAGDVLTVSAGVPAWAAPALQTNTLLDGTVHTDTIAATPALGSLVVGVAGPKWDGLAAAAVESLILADTTNGVHPLTPAEGDYYSGVLYYGGSGEGCTGLAWNVIDSNANPGSVLTITDNFTPAWGALATRTRADTGGEGSIEGIVKATGGKLGGVHDPGAYPKVLTCTDAATYEWGDPTATYSPKGDLIATWPITVGGGAAVEDVIGADVTIAVTGANLTAASGSNLAIGGTALGEGSLLVAAEIAVATGYAVVPTTTDGILTIASNVPGAVAYPDAGVVLSTGTAFSNVAGVEGKYLRYTGGAWTPDFNRFH